MTLDPLGRIGDPVDVVGHVIAFAASAGSYVTGQILYVDGGVNASQLHDACRQNGKSGHRHLENRAAALLDHQRVKTAHLGA